MLNPFKDVYPNFDELFETDRKVIGDLFRRHQMHYFKPFYSTEETLEANLLLIDI